jgi:hypothetical protein
VARSIVAVTIIHAAQASMRNSSVNTGAATHAAAASMPSATAWSASSCLASVRAFGNNPQPSPAPSMAAAPIHGSPR